MRRRAPAPLPQGMLPCYPGANVQDCCARCSRRRPGKAKEAERRRGPVIDATTVLISSNNCPMWAPMKGLP